jgi:prolipoprotein diacylglyceryltransferase
LRTHGSATEIPAQALQPLPVKPAVWDQVEQYFPGRYPSQIVQFLFEGMLVLLLVWLLRRKLKIPGQLAATFLMLYAVFRIPAELIRQPDSQIDPSQGETLGGTAAFLASIGLTMGQFLSVVIFLLGLGLFLWVKRKGGPGYTTEERRSGFWRDTIRDFPEVVGLRKKKDKETS